MSRTVLIVDDDPSFRRLIERIVAEEGLSVVTAADGRSAEQAMTRAEPDVVLLDLHLPDANGVDLLSKFRAERPDLPVLVLTTDTNLDRAVECMRLGALDYIQKPFDRVRLVTSLRNACSHGALSARVRSLTQELRKGEGFSSILGESPAIRAVVALLERVAGRDVSVLLQGESGTGKELAARAVHAESPRRSGPFVAINCGAIPEGLIESELFGHEKGAFTGAHAAKPGCFENAEGGTIFLDEIAELRQDLQVRMLRVLQERTVRRIGSGVDRDLDVRVVAATNRDLQKEAAAGRFREDLYYRLAVFPCTLPPLRERGDDVLLLARSFLDAFARRHRREIREFSPRALEALRRHSWPGNVRELANAVERSVLLEDGTQVSLSSLPDAVVESLDGAPMAAPPVHGGAPTTGEALVGAWRDSDDIVPLQVSEERMIRRALELTGGNVQEASRLLGIGRTTMYRKIELYGLRGDGPDSPDE